MGSVGFHNFAGGWEGIFEHRCLSSRYHPFPVQTAMLHDHPGQRTPLLYWE